MVFSFDSFTLSKLVLFGLGLLATCFAVLFGTLAGQARYGQSSTQLNGVQYILSFGSFTFAFFAFSIVLVQEPEGFYVFDVACNLLIALAFGLFVFEKHLSVKVKKFLLYLCPLLSALYIMFTYSPQGKAFWTSGTATVLSHIASFSMLFAFYIVFKHYQFLPKYYRYFMYLALGYTATVGHLAPYVTPMSLMFYLLRLADFVCLLSGFFIFLTLNCRLQNDLLSFRYAFEQSGSATIFLNLSNQLAFQNKMYARLWQQSKVYYQNAGQTHPVTELVNTKLIDKDYWEGDLSIQTSLGVKYFNVRIYGIYNADGCLTHKVCKLTDFTDKELIRQELEHSAKKLNLLSSKLLKGQEQKRLHIARELHDDIRQYIARELHDDIGQQLSLLAFEIATLEQTSIKDRISEKVTLLLKSVRDLSKQLRPTILDELGLVPAINWFIRQVPSNTLDLSFHYSGSIEKIKPPLDISLFRVVQEAVNNAVKHSRCKNVTIELIATSTFVRLTIEDNGVGFDVVKKGKQAMSGKSLGIISMKERITSFNGKFKIDSELKRGTKVQAEVYFD